MPLTLIASRNRNNDEPVTFGDVPIETSSIMVDCLSVLSQFRRSAGWLYPVRKATDVSYERGIGRLLLFGKTRCIFPDFPAPYFLEFFPRRNVGTYILSFYSGDPSPELSHEWQYYPPSQREFKLFPGVSVETRIYPDAGGQFTAAPDARYAFIFQNWLYWSTDEPMYYRREIGTWNPVLIVSPSEWSTANQSSGRLVL